MEYKLFFNSLQHYVIIQLKGTLEVETAIKISYDIVSSPKFVPSMNQIWDVSDTSFSELTINQAEDVSLQLIEFWKNNQDRKVAIISANDLNLGPVRFFKEIYDINTGRVQVFSSLKQAERWLRIGPIDYPP